jgi:hypothetical protein
LKRFGRAPTFAPRRVFGSPNKGKLVDPLKARSFRPGRRFVGSNCASSDPVTQRICAR